MGILIEYINGHYFSYLTGALFNLVISVIFVLLFLCFPETPRYLLLNNKLDKAEQSLQFYKSIKDTVEINNSDHLMMEMKKLNELIVEANDSKQNKIYLTDLSKFCRKSK